MNAITDNFGLFVDGYLMTLKICLIAAVGAVVLGTVIVSCRVSPAAPLRAFGTGYVNLVRNCPLTVVLLFFAFGIPEVGINASFFTFVVGGLIVYTAAFVCEALRAGINSVPAGQAEAARALGLTFGQNLRSIVLPQAFRSSVPPLGSVLIAMFKNSAVVGAVGVSGDLFQVAQSLTGARGYAPLWPLIGVAVGYLCITLPAAGLLALAERKVAILR
jgi:glutamate transport system permease protein